MEETGLVLRPFVSPWAIALLACVLVGVCVLAYVRTPGALAGRFRALLIALRAMAVAAAGVALLRPSLEVTHHEVVRRPLLLLVDASRSMREIRDMPGGRSRSEAADEVLARNADELEALEGLYSGLRFVPRRAAAPQSAGIQPMAGFLHVASTLARSSPNLVILVCQPDTVINGTPVDEFEAALSAALDQVLVRSRAEAVLVGPPPVPGRPDASRAYAAAAKRLGLRKGVPVVDLYSRFRLMPDWEALFQPPDGQGTTYLVHPNEQGQRIIAREIMTAVTECCHEGFSAAVRHAAYWGESGGS